MKTATDQVLELAEVYEQMPHVLLREANRKSKRNRKSEPRQVSHTPEFIADLDKYKGRNDVLELIKKIEGHLKNREDAYLESNHDAHELDRKWTGYSSVKLYPGEEGDNEIVILYKFHEANDKHVALYRIGNHQHAYRKKSK